MTARRSPAQRHLFAAVLAFALVAAPAAAALSVIADPTQRAIADPAPCTNSSSKGSVAITCAPNAPAGPGTLQSEEQVTQQKHHAGAR
jgi:hypothetical protein